MIRVAVAALLGVALLVLASIAPGAAASTPSADAPRPITCSELPSEARDMLDLIAKGGPFEYVEDGEVYENDPHKPPEERPLPTKPPEYYHAYTVKPPGANVRPDGKLHRAKKRIITGKNGELYFTDNHYSKQSMREIQDYPPDPGGGSSSGCSGPRPVTGAGGAAAEPEEESTPDLVDAQESGKTAQGPLEDAISNGSAPGGIDFSSLSLRYLSDGSIGAPTRYAFSANPTTGSGGPSTGPRESAERSSDAFFVWLSLPPTSFWVNLNPNEPDRITDPELGSTDVGRILLEADLELKRSFARLTQPNTPTGARFWASPGAQDVLDYCAVTRAWIVPGPAEIREDGDAVFVEQAPLVVRTERADLGAANGPCTPPPPDAVARQEALVRTVALPEMQRQVNEDPQYAALRQVYYARVAAEWYRQRSATRNTAFGDLVDYGDVTPWVSRSSWTPRKVFDQYRQSFFQGEYPSQQVTVAGKAWSVTEGGIDLTDIPLQRDTRPAPAGLTESVQQSFDEQTQDPSGQFWLGSVIDVPPPGPPWTLISVGVAVLLAAAIGASYGWRRRQERRRPDLSFAGGVPHPTGGRPQGASPAPTYESSPIYGPAHDERPPPGHGSGYGPGSASRPSYGPSSTASPGYGPPTGRPSRGYGPDSTR